MNGKSRRCKAARDWSRAVIERDGCRCQNCGSSEKLQAHHIIAWRLEESSRFDTDNGITYCSSCHNSIEKKGTSPWIKGRKHTQETKSKMRLAKIGNIPWNFGRRMQIPEERKCRDCSHIKPIDSFTPLERGAFFSHRCKTCRNYSLRKVKAVA
jgi:hypothetical protein